MGNPLYIEFVVDTPFNRGYFIPLDRLSSFINANIGRVMYHSYYAFDQSVIEHYSAHRTLKGYNGIKYPFRNIIDIDGSEKEFTETAKITQEIYAYLTEFCEINEENVQLWFSGSKGFHIHLPNVFGFQEGEGLPGSVKATYEVFFEKWEHAVDYKPTMSTGLIRCPWSLHQKTKLMKVPLSLNQLAAIASSTDPSEYASQENWKKQISIINEPINDDNDGILSTAIVEKPTTANWQQMNDMDNPSSVVTCMQKLALRGPIEGRRHKDALRLLSSWRRHGILPSLARVMLFEWLSLPTSEPNAEWERMIQNVYEQGYSYSCKDEVMSEYCDSGCIFFKNKDFVVEVASIEDLETNYKSYLNKISGNGIDIGLSFGFEESYKLLPGELAIITGDTGMGKSAFVQNLVERAGRKTLYMNLEMHEALLYRRFLQIANDMTKHEVDSIIYENETFPAELGWLDVLSISPKLEAIERLISQKDYKYVVIDTTDGISVEGAGNNSVFALGEIINQLRVIAQSKDITIILVHHLKKRQNPLAPIKLDELSGNRANVTKMDHVFALEPRNGVTDGRVLRSLKTRDGAKVALNFNINFSTFRYYADTKSRPFTEPINRLRAGGSRF